jgi:hypothetical protein
VLQGDFSILARHMLISECHFQEHSFPAFLIRCGCCRHQLLIRLLHSPSPYPYPTFTSTFTNTHRLITRASLSRQAPLAPPLQGPSRLSNKVALPQIHFNTRIITRSSLTEPPSPHYCGVLHCQVAMQEIESHRDQSPLAEPLYFFCENKRREATLRMRNVGADSFPALLIARWRSVHTCSHTYDLVVL